MKIEQKNSNKIHISDLAKNLNVANEIILNWEKEFKVSSQETNPIEYTYEEAKKFKTIKKLLHKKKLSVEQTKEFLINSEAVSTTTSFEEQVSELPTELNTKLMELKNKLIQLKSRL